jgi:N6-L-threonylcarbamoyladenine synthase
LYLLAIESSCDDTAVSVLKDQKPLSNVVSSQLVHETYGGVVPEMASREHQKNIWAVTQTALDQAGIAAESIGCIGYTRGPGLPGSLMVGANFAKGLALGLNIPLVSVNHMEAHILSLLLPEKKPAFPFLCLVVSGGHTLLVLVLDWDQMKVIGSTKDDAVGEAFDKCAKLLGLGYPGGKWIDQLAAAGNPNAFSFPVAKMEEYRFSYSGVKTSFLYFLQEKGPDFVTKNKPDICASIQEALLKPLVQASRKALKSFDIQRLGIAGGVSANSRLRNWMESAAVEDGFSLFVPPFEYCTDNAAMIGLAAWFKWERGLFARQDENTEPRLVIGNNPG